MIVNVKKNNHEMDESLRTQIYFLRSSIKAFDSGEVLEGLRLATTLRILLHDTSKSKSLLRLMGLKGTYYFNTGRPLGTSNHMPQWSLLRLVAESDSEEVRFEPLLDNYAIDFSPNWRTFKEWWEQPILATKLLRETISRKELVLYLSNKDGGAHVDPKIKESYYLFSRETGEMGIAYDKEKNGILMATMVMPWAKRPKPGDLAPNGAPYIFPKDIHLKTIRQISFELLKSFENSPKLSKYLS